MNISPNEVEQAQKLGSLDLKLVTSLDYFLPQYVPIISSFKVLFSSFYSGIQPNYLLYSTAYNEGCTDGSLESYNLENCKENILQ